jgi:hypothetical protein
VTAYWFIYGAGLAGILVATAIFVITLLIPDKEDK